MAKILLALTVLLVGDVFKQVDSFSCPIGDPCAGDIITIRNGNRRGRDATVVPGQEICDEALNVGWYRFVDDDENPLTVAVKENSNGGHQCVEQGRCSTNIPISLTEPAPTNAGETKQLKGCLNFIFCCFFSLNVCARFCDSNNIGTIYYLTPPPACSVAYCTNAKGCSDVGNKQCKQPYPTMSFDPVITADSRKNKVTNVGEEVIFRCELFGPETDNAEYVIHWMKDADKKPAVTQIIDSIKTPAEVSLRELFKVTELAQVKMNFNLVCQATAGFRGSAEKSPVRRSNSFFAGLSVAPLTLFVSEDDEIDKHTIFVKPTVPVVCETNQRCYLSVAFGGATFTAQKDVVTSNCGVQFHKTNWNKFQTFEIAAVRDQVEEEEPSSKRIRVSLAPVELTGKEIPKTIANEWFGLPPQYVQVKVANAHSSRCKGTGDPHFTTFDNNYFHYYKYGDFWLVRNRGKRTSGVLEVQSRIWKCRRMYTDVSCHCGVAVREGNHIVSIDQCYGKHLKVNVIPTRIKKHTPDPLPKSFHIYKNAAGTSHKIQLPSGATVKVEAYTWGMSVYVQVSEEDHKNTEGFCGNNNGISEDDLRGPNGQSYTKDGRSIVEDAFADSWSVTLKENLFENEVLKELKKDNPVTKRNNFCQCTSKEEEIKGKCLVQAEESRSLLVQPKAFGAEKWIYNTPGVRTKRDVAGENDIPTDEDDIDDDYEFVYDKNANPIIPQWPTPSGITEEQAVKTCTKVLLSSPVAQSCIADGRIEEITSETIDSCIEDIKLTDDLSIPNAYISSVLLQCEESLASDVSYWKPNVSVDTDVNDTVLEDDSDFFLKPAFPPVIADSICPNDCSGHGQCVNATCFCHYNFTGPDCSIVAGAPPTALTFMNKGLCDRRKKPCRTAYVIGEGFIDTDNLSCVVENSATGETFKVTSSFQSIYEVTCALPPSFVKPYSSLNVYNEPFQHFSIRVTVDGKKFSTALNYTIYDSGCFTCIGPGQCSRKDNSCLIENHCFAAIEPDPDNWCQQCLPEKDTQEFTNRTDNTRPYIEAPAKIFVVENDKFSFIVPATDPDNRPTKVQVFIEGDRLTSQVLESKNWTWQAPPNAGKTSRFSFIATDECEATSDIYRPDIHVINCPCKPNGRCVQQDGGPIGSGRYKCHCNYGYDGTYCERFIIPTMFFQEAPQRNFSLNNFQIYGARETQLGALRLFPEGLIKIRDNDNSHLKELVCTIQEEIDVTTETFEAESEQLQVSVNRTLKINGAATIESYLKAMESLNYSYTGKTFPAKNRNILCQVTDSSGLRSSKIHIVIGFDHCLAQPCVHGTCQTTESGYQCYCSADYEGGRCQWSKADRPTCSWCCDANERNDSCRLSDFYPACSSNCCKREKICTAEGLCYCTDFYTTFANYCSPNDALCCYSGREENKELCLSEYGHLPDCEKDCCNQSEKWKGTALSACGVTLP